MFYLIYINGREKYKIIFKIKWEKIQDQNIKYNMDNSVSKQQQKFKKITLHL